MEIFWIVRDKSAGYNPFDGLQLSVDCDDLSFPVRHPAHVSEKKVYGHTIIF